MQQEMCKQAERERAGGRTLATWYCDISNLGKIRSGAVKFIVCVVFVKHLRFQGTKLENVQTLALLLFCWIYEI